MRQKLKIYGLLLMAAIGSSAVAEQVTFESACNEIRGDIPANTTQVVCRRVGENFNASIHHDQGQFLWGAVGIADGVVTSEVFAAIESVAQGLGGKLSPSLLAEIKSGGEGKRVGVKANGFVAIWESKDTKRKREIGGFVFYPDKAIPTNSVVCRVAGCAGSGVVWLE
ncbi:MAG: hypothetical protein K2X81_16445 [Candidatus Obscuribacterales bacterium]|nr:hypothetical protein [Candidatus Obscuribacterales bacterium]